MADPLSAPSASRFAPESRASIEATPGRVLARSTDVGWTSVLLTLRDKTIPVGETTTYESLPTPDHAVALLVGGDFEIEGFDGRMWRRVVRQPGSAGLTPGGVVNRVRWRLRSAVPLRTAQLFLPSALLQETREEFRRTGVPGSALLGPSLGFTDPAVSQAIVALLRALHAGAPDLYAESVAQFLAVHLLSAHAAPMGGAEDRRWAGPLSDQRLARALEYLSSHFHEPVTLARVASEAGVSKFHFVRLFRLAMGEAPHAYLIRLRLDCARQLLRETDLSVAEIARSCGYPGAAHFARAFGRETGQTPTAFRDASRRSRR